MLEPLLRCLLSIRLSCSVPHHQEKKVVAKCSPIKPKELPSVCVLPDVTFSRIIVRIPPKKSTSHYSMVMRIQHWRIRQIPGWHRGWAMASRPSTFLTIIKCSIGMMIKTVVPDNWSLRCRKNCGCWMLMLLTKVFSLPLDWIDEDGVVKDGKERIFVAIRIIKTDSKHGLLILRVGSIGSLDHFWSTSGENIVGIPTEACAILKRYFSL